MHFNHFRLDDMTILLFIRLRANVRRPLIPNQEVTGTRLARPLVRTPTSYVKNNPNPR